VSWIDERIDKYFVDMDLMPLFIQVHPTQPLISCAYAILSYTCMQCAQCGECALLAVWQDMYLGSRPLVTPGGDPTQKGMDITAEAVGLCMLSCHLIDTR